MKIALAREYDQSIREKKLKQLEDQRNNEEVEKQQLDIGTKLAMNEDASDPNNYSDCKFSLWTPIDQNKYREFERVSLSEKILETSQCQTPLPEECPRHRKSQVGPEGDYRHQKNQQDLERDLANMEK